MGQIDENPNVLLEKAEYLGLGPMVDYWFGFLSELSAIVASGIAIYIFIFKRKSISSVFHLLLNYAYQLSLSELNQKLELLNHYNVKDDDARENVINIINEIIGQIKGSRILERKLAPILEDAQKLVGPRGRLTEPRKRALVSEIRERVRNLNIESMDGIVGGKS